ncbi:MAG: efflux RND transporter periplasmic adaptor subunit [Planctomycetota bacterium]|nr:MAG: efflux RND transporter periplasmic adaptor subunit [Planctomycetota bacterium]
MKDKFIESEDESQPQGRPPRKGFFRVLIRVVFMYLLPLIVVTVGAIGAVHMVRTGPKAKERKPEQSATLVQVRTISHTDEFAMISAMGTVVAAQEVILQPRVSGEIVKMNPALIPGGRFEANEMILQIDPRDYELALEQSHSQVAQAKYEVKMEQGHQDIAKREWELLGVKDASELDRELALRKPHLEKANSSLSAALAAEQKAKLDLERTTIRAPFNGIVTAKNVDLGAQVTPQTQLARMVGTDEYWVQVSVPVDQLKWITIPRTDGEQGSPVRIYQQIGSEKSNEWTGYVLRLMGDLELQGRMARVLVVVRDPLGLELADSEDRTPLLIGSYVNVVIEGIRLNNVIAMPRSAVRDGTNIWIMDENCGLQIRKVKIFWRSRNKVLIRNGIEDGEQIVVSDLPAPVAGMKLRVDPGIERKTNGRSVGESER